MDIQTNGNFVSLEDMRAQGKSMKRVAFGGLKASDAYDDLRAAGATKLGEEWYGRAGHFVNGVTADGKLFIYEYNTHGPSCLYVER